MPQQCMEAKRRRFYDNFSYCEKHQLAEVQRSSSNQEEQISDQKRTTAVVRVLLLNVCPHHLEIISWWFLTDILYRIYYIIHTTFYTYPIYCRCCPKARPGGFLVLLGWAYCWAHLPLNTIILILLLSAPVLVSFKGLL